MTDPLPFTSDELKAARRWRQQANLVLAGVYHFDRLLAAVADANQRADDLQARLDDVVATEQDALRLYTERQAANQRAERAETENAAMRAALGVAERALRDHPMQAFRTEDARRRRANAIDAVRALVADQPIDADPGWPDETRRQPDQEPT